MQIVGAIFEEEQAANILNVPIYKESLVDRRVWKFNSHGLYSVKSAYRLYMDHFATFDEFKVQGDWTKLWDLKLPPKVKCFLWRCCRNCLPIRTRLQSRGIPCSPLCVLCDVDMETS